MNIHKSKIMWFVYLVLLVCMALPQGFDTIINQKGEQKLLASSTAQEIIDFHGDGDMGSYAKGGRFFKNNNIDAIKECWFINCWAPGMFVLYAVLLKLGETTPAVFFIVMMSVVLWASIFNKINNLLNQTFEINSFISFIVPLMLLLISFFREMILGNFVLLSESFSMGVFVLAVLFLVNNLYNNKKTDLILSVLFFILAAYIKASFDFYMRIFTLIWIVSWTLTMILQLLKNKNKLGTINKNSFSTIFSLHKKIIFILICFFVFTLPWRIFHTPSWINISYMYSYIWKSDEQLNGPNFVTEGGVNASACHIDPETCKIFREKFNQGSESDGIFTKNLIKKTRSLIIAHPFAWLYYKLPFLSKYWFQEGNSHATVQTVALNIMFTINLLVIFALALKNRKSLDLFLVLVVLSLGLSSILPSLVLHFEARYLYPLKLFSCIALIISVAAWIQSLKNRNSISQ